MNRDMKVMVGVFTLLGFFCSHTCGKKTSLLSILSHKTVFKNLPPLSDEVMNVTKIFIIAMFGQNPSHAVCMKKIIKTAMFVEFAISSNILLGQFIFISFSAHSVVSYIWPSVQMGHEKWRILIYSFSKAFFISSNLSREFETSIFFVS